MGAKFLETPNSARFRFFPVEQKWAVVGDDHGGWTVGAKFLETRQGYWSGLPFPSPGDLPNPGIEPSFLHCRQILYQLSYKGSP